MSLCFRTLPGKLSSLVSGGRKPLSKLDRHQLQKHAESSAFLKQFLGTQRALSVRANTTEKSVPSVGYTLPPNLSLASLDTCNQWNKKLARRYTDDESNSATMYWAQGPRRLHRSQRPSVVLLKSRKHVAPIGITSDDIKMFQAQSVVGNDKSNSFLDNNRVISLESLYSSRETSVDKNILLTSDDTSTLKANSQQPSPRENEGKPSQEQLQSIVDCLSRDVCHVIYRIYQNYCTFVDLDSSNLQSHVFRKELPILFLKPQDFSIYTDDLIFINNIRGVTTSGRMNYAKQLMLLRLIGHIKFAHIKLDIIKITMHTENDTVKVRWRIRGVTGWTVFSMFWKHKILKIRDAINTNHEVWHDGFSTFYVNANGKIYKHIADKMMPDQDVAAKKEDLRIAPKLALFTGLASMFDSNEDFFGLSSNFKLHQLK